MGLFIIAIKIYPRIKLTKNRKTFITKCLKQDPSKLGIFFEKTQECNDVTFPRYKFINVMSYQLKFQSSF